MSDSNYAVRGINEWIENWIKQTDSKKRIVLDSKWTLRFIAKLVKKPIVKDAEKVVYSFICQSVPISDILNHFKTTKKS